MQSGNKPIKYVAEVAPVKEVILHGGANLAYWQKKLAAQNLQPLAVDGQAQLLINATEARFWGILFRESLIAVHVQPPAAMPPNMPAMYLLQAWNSVSAFAWVERTMFSTPYAAGKILIEPNPPARLQFGQQGNMQVAATMAAGNAAATNAEENWHGVVFLPPRTAHQQMFIAKLTGHTDHFPFRAGLDSLELTRSKTCEAIGCLIDSNFTPQTWSVRSAAAHAKSKTYRVDQFFAG